MLTPKALTTAPPFPKATSAPAALDEEEPELDALEEEPEPEAEAVAEPEEPDPEALAEPLADTA